MPALALALGWAVLLCLIILLPSLLPLLLLLPLVGRLVGGTKLTLTGDRLSPLGRAELTANLRPRAVLERPRQHFVRNLVRVRGTARRATAHGRRMLRRSDVSEGCVLTPESGPRLWRSRCLLSRILTVFLLLLFHKRDE